MEISENLKAALEKSPARLYLIRWMTWNPGTVAWAVDPLPEVIVAWLKKQGVTVKPELEEGEQADYVISLEDPRYERDLSETRVRKMADALKDNGTLILSVHNPLGLTYFNGTSEPYYGKPFAGITGYADKTQVPGLTLKALQKLLTAAGVRKSTFYYPMPDAVFPVEIYSDKFLPKQGSLQSNGRNFRAPGYEMFDIGLAYDRIIQEGLFTEFASSYLILGRKEA